MLTVRDIHAYYGQAHILSDVSLEVNAGEVVVLLGRNGAGKSTTLKSIIGLVRPTQGEISFRGERIERHAPYKIARLGLCQAVGIVMGNGARADDSPANGHDASSLD